MNITHSISIKTTPDRLFEAVTTDRGLTGWWAPSAKADSKVGGLVVLSFSPEFSISFRVESLVPGRRVTWTAVDVPPDWKGTQIEFDINPGEGALVGFTFTQSGFPDRYENFGCFNFLWAQYVRSIKLLLETGKGEPYGTPEAATWHPLEG